MREILKKLGIESNLDFSEKYFINRINNIIFHTNEIFIDWDILNKLNIEFIVDAGLKYSRALSVDFYFESQKDFKTYLLYLQILINRLSLSQAKKLSKHIDDAFNLASLDLGYNIKNINGEYILMISGSKLLDDKLIDDVLNILNADDKNMILNPYKKGLKEFFESKNDKSKLKNVVRDIYESIESLAKYICKNDKDLTANKELFINKINANYYYKENLKHFIDYSNEFRHPPKKNIELIPKEVEAYIYMSGIFIRLALN